MSASWLVDERWLKAYPMGESLSIGRGPENAVILRDPSVSRVHATIERNADGYTLRALGATGTLVNGNPGDDRVLHEGDVIEIASSTLRFTSVAPDEETIVVPRDAPLSMDRLAPSTRAYPLPRRTIRTSARIRRGIGATLAFVLGSLLILLALR